MLLGYESRRTPRGSTPPELASRPELAFPAVGFQPADMVVIRGLHFTVLEGVWPRVAALRVEFCTVEGVFNREGFVETWLLEGSPPESTGLFGGRFSSPRTERLFISSTSLLPCVLLILPPSDCLVSWGNLEPWIARSEPFVLWADIMRRTGLYLRWANYKWWKCWKFMK